MGNKSFEELIKEETAKFRMLSEYAFYNMTEQEPEVTDPALPAEEPIIDPASLETAVPGSEDPALMDPALATDPTLGDPMADPAMGGDDEIVDDAPTDGGDSTEEVDVTDLIKNSEETKTALNSVDDKLTQIDSLMAKLDDLESRLTGMDAIVTKIDDLEMEFEKRNPTPEEKLDLRSLSSYPYNLKLTDYWSDKKGIYDVMGTEEKPEPEYTLTQDDVDDYSDDDIKNSFKDINSIR